MDSGLLKQTGIHCIWVISANKFTRQYRERSARNIALISYAKLMWHPVNGHWLVREIHVTLIVTNGNGFCQEKSRVQIL